MLFKSESTIPDQMQWFSDSWMSYITMYSFESQSSPVQLITLKAIYLPNILWMRVNLLPT